ncbi:hypothetical protein GCM10020000_72320 [Streptomyces olivoverticillatus]
MDAADERVAQGGPVGLFGRQEFARRVGLGPVSGGPQPRQQVRAEAAGQGVVALDDGGEGVQLRRVPEGQGHQQPQPQPVEQVRRRGGALTVCSAR